MLDYWREQHPQSPAESVAATLKAPLGTVRKWFDGVCAPSLIWFSRAVSAYGPEFLWVAMGKPDGWLNHAARMAEQERLEAEIAALKSRLERRP